MASKGHWKSFHVICSFVDLQLQGVGFINAIWVVIHGSMGFCSKEASTGNILGGAATCSEGFVICFLKVPLACLGSMSAAVQTNSLGNSQKTVYKTFGTSGRPTHYIHYRQLISDILHISEAAAGNVKYSWSIKYLLLLHESSRINHSVLLLYNIARFIGQVVIILLLVGDSVWAGRLGCGKQQASEAWPHHCLCYTNFNFHGRRGRSRKKLTKMIVFF